MVAMTTDNSKWATGSWRQAEKLDCCEVNKHQCADNKLWEQQPHFTQPHSRNSLDRT